MSDPNPKSKSKSADEPVLRPHTYDGIREYDQRLPNWWLFTLYIMMGFTLVYWVAAYQFDAFVEDGPWASAKVASMRVPKGAAALLTTSGADTQLWQWSRDPAKVASGKAAYNLTCVACHAADLSAKMGGVPLPGLPLNDAEWKYGGKPSEILKIITKGSPDVTKGMVAWETVLGPTKCAEVAAYVLSHHEPPSGLLEAAAAAGTTNSSSSPAPTDPGPAAK